MSNLAQLTADSAMHQEISAMYGAGAGAYDVDLWSATYSRSRPFVIRPVEISFATTGYGKKMTAEIGNEGDLVAKLWLVFKLGSLNGGTDNSGDPASANARYVDDVGRAIIKQIELSINNQVYDRQLGEYMHICEELMTPMELWPGMSTGKSGNEIELTQWAAREQKMYVPLEFYFTRSWSQAYNGVSAYLSEAKVHVTLRDSKSEIIDPRADINGQTYSTISGDATLSDVHLLAEVIYVTDKEREQLINRRHAMIVDQVQLAAEYEVAGGLSSYTFELNASNDVKELIFVFRSTSNTTNKQWFNFKGEEVDEYIDEAFKTLTVKYNNQCHVEAMDPIYFRVAQPRMYHSRVPDKQIYVLSHSLFPESTDLSGAINYSRINKVHFTLAFSSGSASVAGTFYVFARSVNKAGLSDGSQLLDFAAL